MGIKTLNSVNGRLSISDYRKAAHIEDNMDVDVLMRVLRIQEYEDIIRQYYGRLPDVGYYEMYNACKELMRKIPATQLSGLAVSMIKQRKNGL